MAKNDVVLLDGIIDQRVADRVPSEKRDEVFEYFAIEQILKDYDLSDEEIEDGWIDGGGDGGIDGFYILINGSLLDDPDSFAWPRNNAAIEVWIVTCKHHPTFLQAPLDAILATVHELFDFSRDQAELHGKYSDELLRLRRLFQLAYRRLSIGRPIMQFRVVYGSRGDTGQIGASVAARAEQIRALLADLFSSCSADFHFVGAAELVERHRRAKKFALDLPFLEHLATGRESYVLLVRLDDYWRFVSDENGNLRRYLFDSNVRDFLGVNPVNDEIARSLADESGPDFWWLNNGITILVTNATVPGKTIQLQDIQIVNGLQTTESIFRHFSAGLKSSANRALLVKIIVSSDAQARDQIIRATNNQSPVEIAALHATDKIQRDIEAILEQNGWFYERRKNYYRNIGKQQARLVTPTYLASAAVAILMQNPTKATRLKARFMRTQSGYDAVFSERTPIDVWPILVEVYKQVELHLNHQLLRHRVGERFIGTWRPLISLLVVARRLKTFAFGASLVLDLRGVQIDSREVDEAWCVVEQNLRGQKRTLKPSVQLVRECCRQFANAHALLGYAEVGRKEMPSGKLYKSGDAQSVKPEFLEQVNAVLPEQPWPPGVHIEVAEKLDSKPSYVSRAIQQLIAEKRRNQQFDGVVYDPEGRVLAVDAERVPYTVDELNAINVAKAGGSEHRSD